MTIPWFEIYYVSEWIIRLTMLVVIPRHRNPASAMAWLLAIFFQPWVGLILFLLIGATRPSVRKVQQHARLREALRSMAERFRPALREQRTVLNEHAAELSRLIERLGGMPAVNGNEVELIDDSGLFIDRLVQDIDAAQDHVHLLFYIYLHDEVGQRVNDALTRATTRGVQCRLLVDAIGSRPMLKKHASQITQAGIELQDSFPVMSLRRSIGRVDWRNHRKIAVIDGRVAYTGSQNIVDPSYGHKDPKLIWRDLMARITGPAVLELQAIFVSDWFMETDEFLDGEPIFPFPETPGDIPVQVLPSGPIYSSESYQRLIVTALYHAQDQVTITTPYFVPDEAFMQAVEVARLRGVEVQLIVPEISDQRLPGWAARAYFAELLSYGVKIYQYTEGLLHAKSMSIDRQFCFFGSSNFDIRSFMLDFEVNVVFYGEKETEALREQQREYIRYSTLLRSKEWGSRPYIIRIGENIAKLFSPLL